MVGSISPVLSESFEDVLYAVQETARGRWFLDEFAKRKKAEDTAVILAAIVKLESALARMPEPQAGNEHAALEKAKSAIARAKAQIKKLSPQGSPLSEEAQLFAKLADLARGTHQPDIAENVKESIHKGVEVALKLVTELDAELGPSTEIGQKYFTQDSDIFEAPPATKAKAEPEKPAFIPPEIHAKQPPAALPAAVDTVVRGAKLTINRATAAPAQQVEEEPAKQTSPQDQPPTAEAKPAEQRIVIIRRAPDETIEVPLLDKKDPAADAA